MVNVDYPQAIMAEFNRKQLVLILIFWILCPTLDMVTDMNLAIRLFRGPGPDLRVSGGKSKHTSIYSIIFILKYCSTPLS